jgi:TolB-like protein
LVLAVALVGIGWWLVRNRGAPPSSGKAVGRITSLAVKPLDDYSGDTNQAYLSDAMTEALCSALGNISALRVPGRSTVMRYKHSPKSIPEMAQELNVDAIVEGSVQRAGNRMLVTAQLFEAGTDRHLWSTNYERDLGDFFKVQSEVARAIAAKVQVRLTREDQARLARARTAKPETIEAYLRGMQQWWHWFDEGTTNAPGYFQKAIEIEPDYAPAHAGVALTYLTASTRMSLWPPREGVPQGKEAAQRAIQLDPTLADAYVARGLARFSFDWDWAGAEQDFQRALELNPNSSLALDGYANLLAPRRRFDEAAALLSKALELDPLSPGLHYDLGWTYWASGQFGRAMSQFRKTLELDRDEAQSVPAIFAALRGLIDRDRKQNGRFLLLGSAHPPLIRHVSESLAGRVGILDLDPFTAAEVAGQSPARALFDLWLRGGFPDAFAGDFREWWEACLRTYIERDLPQHGLSADPMLLRRLLTMLAHCQGGLLNLSQLGQSLGVSYHTVDRYVNLLE